MRSVSPYLPQLSQLSSALKRSLAATAEASTPVAKAASPVAPAAPANTAQSGDSATWSRAGQALLDRPEAQQKKVLSLLDTMFGITNVASMALDIDVSHAHQSHTASREVQQGSDHGLTYSYQDFAQEAETTALHASGTITLDDGRSFALDLDYQHSLTVTQSRSFDLTIERPSGATAEAWPPDLRGTGKKLLDQLFSPESLAKSLSEALRQLGPANPPADSAEPANLRARLEVSPLSTAALNSVFGRLRDQQQQRQAELFLPHAEIRPHVDVQG